MEIKEFITMHVIIHNNYVGHVTHVHMQKDIMIFIITMVATVITANNNINSLYCPDLYQYYSFEEVIFEL